MSHLRGVFLLLLFACSQVYAQEFYVASFRSLDNDASALVTPVLDLTGEPCALLRVVGSKDLEFSSPLGIVKRKDQVGEIMLYLPNGSKMLTIKHPEWGIIRDYRFSEKLIGQHSYELLLKEPERKPLVVHDTITNTITDTITIVQQRTRVPLRFNAMVTVGLVQGDIALGLMLSIMRRHGVYVHPLWNMCSTKEFTEECDADGRFLDGSMPYYTGKVHRMSCMLTAGAIHRVSSYLSVYEGIGWGKTDTSWQSIGLDGDAVWIKNKDKSYQGLALELGSVVNLGGWSATLSVSTISAKTWAVNIGFGL